MWGWLPGVVPHCITPRIIPHIDHTDDVGPFDVMISSDAGISKVGVSVDDVPPPPPPPGTYDQECLQMVVVIMDNLMSLINPCGEVFTRLFETTHIANGYLVI